MELQNIHLSILYTLLPDYLLNLLRMIGIMSSPIHGHYRCAPSARTQTTSVKESKKSRMVENSDKEGGNSNVLLEALQPQPLVAAMYSLFQSALHCTSQKTTNSSMTGIQFNTSNAPTFCYFFIDMEPTYGDKIDYSDYTFDSNHKNIEDTQNISTNLNCSVELNRQRSISEGSDDSFICFEEEGDTAETPIIGHIDFDSSANSADCKLDDQEHLKKVRFNLKPEVHVMHTWDFAYRAARKGEWQEIARDRDRFQQRIRRVSPILNNVLSSNHREKIYKDRFIDLNL